VAAESTLDRTTAEKQLEKIVEALGAGARESIDKWLDARSAVEFRAMEGRGRRSVHRTKSH
jgi:hypothetical protein